MVTEWTNLFFLNTMLPSGVSLEIFHIAFWVTVSTMMALDM